MCPAAGTICSSRTTSSVDWNLAISADGRYVGFGSSSNLVRGDTNGTLDVFVRDRQAGTTERVSVSSKMAQGNGPSHVAGISSNGRYVTFTSDASNLVIGDTNNRTDVFVRDRLNKTTQRVSISSRNVQANGASGYSDGFFGVSSGWITGDGRYVSFKSEASNLVPGDTNGVSDIFVRDRKTGTTERVSITSSGAQAKSCLCDPDGDGMNGSFFWLGRTITQDGRYVTFYSSAPALVPDGTSKDYGVYVRDRVAHMTTRVSVSSEGVQANDNCYLPMLSGDGSVVVFETDATNLVPNDINGAHDVFARTR